jgi:hypothetical protein
LKVEPAVAANRYVLQLFRRIDVTRRPTWQVEYVIVPIDLKSRVGLNRWTNPACFPDAADVA